MDKTGRFCLEAEEKEELFYYSSGKLSHPDVLAIDPGWSPSWFLTCVLNYRRRMLWCVCVGGGCAPVARSRTFSL